MPVIHINMGDGRTLEQKRELVQNITDGVVKSLECPRDVVMVFLNEYPRQSIAKGGKLVSES